MSIYFDSKDKNCKKPFGAVLCGTDASFSVICSEDEGICGGKLRLWAEFAGVQRSVPLNRQGGAWSCVEIGRAHV